MWLIPEKQQTESISWCACRCVCVCVCVCQLGGIPEIRLVILLNVECLVSEWSTVQDSPRRVHQTLGNEKTYSEHACIVKLL